MGHIVDTGGTLQVKTVVLDQLHVAGDVYPPTFMKIDIEGAELSALRGAIAILAEFHPTIFLATHGSNVHRECVSLLMSLDYDLQSIDGKNIEQSCEILATYKS